MAVPAKAAHRPGRRHRADRRRGIDQEGSRRRLSSDSLARPSGRIRGVVHRRWRQRPGQRGRRHRPAPSRSGDHRAAAFHGRAERDGRDRPSDAISPVTRPEPWAAPPTQRDRHLQFIARHCRAARQKASGYTIRARAEAAIGRFKQVIGDGLRWRTDERRATEVDVAVHVRNRMLDLGGPNSVRIA